MLRKLVLTILVFSALSCAIADGPRQKLKRTVFSFNEGLRWGRYNEVLPSVSPAALEHFSAMHQGWGDTIQISNAEVLHSVVDDKAKKASIEVKFTWYKIDELVVHDTVTLQHWEMQKATWYLVAEEYRSGTPF